MNNKPNTITSLVRPGDKMLIAITFPAELDESESCHPDIVLEDFLASRNDGSWQAEVHSILPSGAPLEVGCVVTTNGGQRHTIAEIGFAGSEAIAENCYYHWYREWPYKIGHAAMNPDRDTVVSVSWPVDVDKTDLLPFLSGAASARIIAAEYRKALAVIEAIEERFLSGSDTYEDWKFMGDAARGFLEADEEHPTKGAK